ncbi:BnaC08g10710D [Brassica napus]|uniref:BnaC08g10710D protein n=2 Tax=Brassica TaxID=3705 RepID=A0A078HXJ3_BRANA|nr:BnaC08g10710D [Brassica napus]VDD55138.1 unnamed protein product [Brassica oleracea]
MAGLARLMERSEGGVMIRYDKCIKDCDKAVERDRKHMPGKEQLCRRWKKSRQVTAKNGWFCWLCYCSAHPLL